MTKCDNCHKEDNVVKFEVSDYFGKWSKNMNLCVPCIVDLIQQGYVLQVVSIMKSQPVQQ